MGNAQYGKGVSNSPADAAGMLFADIRLPVVGNGFGFYPVA
jgi:hypothetical protein